MRLRTFVGLSLAVTVIAGNTALLIRLKDRRGAARTRPISIGPLTPPPETRVALRAPTPRDAPLLADELPEADRPVFRVTVRDVMGRAIDGATVRVEGDRRGRPRPFPQPPYAQGTTGADGRIELRPTRRARSRVVVSKEGFATRQGECVGSDLEVRLTRSGAIRGRVVEEGTGTPIAGAEVKVHMQDARTTTDEGGNFALRDLGYGSLAVVASSDSHVPANIGVPVAAGSESTIEFRLKRGFTLRGRVVFAGSDRTIEEGTISVSERTMFELVKTGRTASLGPDGRFELRGLHGPEQLFRVVTGDSVYRATGQWPQVDPATGAQVGEVVVTLPPNNPQGLAFRGVVRDEAGRPIEGAGIVAGRSVLPRTRTLDDGGPGSERQPEGRTDGSGGYRVVAEGGGGEVLALHPDFAPTLFLLPPRSRSRAFDLVLVRGATLVVTVRDEAGAPVADAEVAALLRHPDPARSFREFGDPLGVLRSRPLTDSRGRAAIRGLGPGSWYLAARSANGKTGGRAVLDVDAGAKEIAADLVVRPLPSPSGRVVDEGGSPIAGAWVSAGAPDLTGRRPMSPTGPDGRFRFLDVMALPEWESMGGVPVDASSRTQGGTLAPTIVPFDGEIDIVLEPRGSGR